MDRLPIESVRVKCEQYRSRVSKSSGTALSSSEETLIKREAARSAARRHIYYFAVQNTGLELFIWLLLLSCISAPWMVRLLHASPDSLTHINWDLPAFRQSASAHSAAKSTLVQVCKYPLAVTGPALMFFVMYPLYAPVGRVRPLNIRRLLIVLAISANAIAVSLFLFAESGGVQGNNWRIAGAESVRGALMLSYVLAASLAVVFLLFLPFVAFISSVKSWLVRPILRRHDLLLLAMIDVCATTHRRRDTWFADSARTEVVRAIEAAARTAEAAFRTGLIPSPRYLVRNDALRLAAVIRQHKKPILRATGPSAFDRVTESMWSGVVALIEDDWAALTAAAPPVTAATKLRRFASRIGPQAVLLGAAFAIPLVPAVAEEPAVASSVRVTLIVTAILGLALPRESSARAPILDVLGKALPFKPDK
ncbi:hypothetical protein AB0G85_20520 [Streptomyces sioyaensis]|uniref:hypothetical protein n=1 Tax=Streptomyces sioyaensis TaxID=67364 RepID=UPI0033D6C520